MKATQKYVPGLVSVVIPAYNQAEYLREAIQSAIDQTYRSIEIIVVDDGSTDHTANVCTSFAPIVRYFYQNNDGSRGAGARNNAMLQARGEWIALLDQDDRWRPGKLSTQVSFLKCNPEVGAVFTLAEFIDSNGNSLHRCKQFVRLSADPFHDVLTGFDFTASSALVRTASLGSWAPCYSDGNYKQPADAALWYYLARRHPLHILEDPLTEYRLHGANSSTHELGHYEENRRLQDSLLPELHEDCNMCRLCFAEGIRSVKDRAARHFLDEFYILAQSSRPIAGVRYILRALKVSPLTVMRPRRIASIGKLFLQGLLAGGGG